MLTAVGIPCQLSPVGDGVELFIAPPAADRARQQLASYERETWGRVGSAAASALGLLRPGNNAGYCDVLVFVYAAQQRGALAIEWGPVGAAQAGLIRDGVRWRTLVDRRRL